MGIRSVLSKPFANIIAKDQQKWSLQPAKFQGEVFQNLMKVGSKTLFGNDHGLTETTNYEDFKKQVPIRDYEDLSPYVQKIIEGGSNVLWKGQASLLC